MTKPTKWHVHPAKTQIRQADLSLRRVHTPFCWFCHKAAQILFCNIDKASPSHPPLVISVTVNSLLRYLQELNFR